MTREAELAKRLVSAVRSVIGEQSAVLHEPTFSGKETEYLKECISTGFVSSVGKFVDRFEFELKVREHLLITHLLQVQHRSSN